MENKKIRSPYSTLVCTAVLSLILGLVFVFSGQAQQDSQYTQYMYNTQTINPAYAGSREVLRFTSLYRNQWVGLDGAPKTLNFSVDTPLGYRKNMGMAINFTKDKIGPADESSISADFSYNIDFSDTKIRFAFGLKGGLNLLNVDYNKLNIYNPSDAVQQFNIDNRMKPMVGVGFYLHDTQTWYAGVSVPNVLNHSL